MENIRPQNIYEALLIRRIDPNSEIAVLENGYEILHDSKGHRVLQEDYEIDCNPEARERVAVGAQDHFRTYGSEATSAIHLQ